MSKRTGYARVFSGALTVLACAIAGALHAQEAPKSGAIDLTTVTVTGTNIRGAEPVGNAVQVITAEQIKDSGKATIADFLRQLPANFAGGVGTSDNVQRQDAGSAGANLTGGEGVNLRGLGALSTLVLVNGRRVASSGQFGDFVDISNIPLAAIDRVEVLQDGASAVYGSDAVGGVVNIILKRSGEGFATTLRTGTATQGGGGQFQLGQTWGRSWDTGNMIVGAEFNRQGRVAATDRDSFNGGDFSPQGGVDWRRANSRVSTNANIFSTGAASNGNVVYSVPNGDGTGLTVADLVPVTDGVGGTSDLWRHVDLTPRMSRQSVFLSFDQSAGDATMLYGDLRYTHRKGNYNQGYAAVYDTVPVTSPYRIAGVTNNFGVLLDDLILRRDVEVGSYAANFGADFTLSDKWRAQANVSWSREDQNRTSDALRNSNVIERLASGAFAPSSLACALSGLTAANIGAVAGATPAQQYCASLDYEAFNPYSTGPLSSRQLSQLIGYEDLDYTSWLGQGSFKVDGDLMELPGGTLKVAVGVDYRKEHIDGNLDFNYRSINPASVPYGVTEREVSAGYVEAAIPVVGRDNALPYLRALDFSVAARYESYSGLGSFNTTNPKFGVRIKPTDSLTLRGSWGTSFHAPPMRFMYNGPQPVQGGNAAFLRADLYNAPCNTTLVPLNGVVGTPGGSGNCTFSTIIVSGGAGPNLKPEKSDTWTFGFDFKPESLPGFNLGINYFNLKIDDRLSRIQSSGLTSILSQYFSTGSTPYIGNLSPNPSAAEAQGLLDDPRYLGQIGRGPAQSADDVAMIVYATQTNLASLKMDGIDFNVSYAFDAAQAGSFDVFARGTSLFSYKVKGTPADDWVNQLGQYSAVGNPVRLRGQAGVSWSKSALRATLTANHAAGYECRVGCYVPSAVTGMPQLAASPIRIASWTTLDLRLDYDLGGWGDAFRDTHASFIATNLTDRNPPFVDGGAPVNGALATSYDATNASVMGRTLALMLSKRW